MYVNRDDEKDYLWMRREFIKFYNSDLLHDHYRLRINIHGKFKSAHKVWENVFILHKNQWLFLHFLKYLYYNYLELGWNGYIPEDMVEAWEVKTLRQIELEKIKDATFIRNKQKAGKWCPCCDIVNINISCTCDCGEHRDVCKTHMIA